MRLQKSSYILVLVLLNILLLIYSLDFDFGNVINGGDTQLLLNPKLFFKKSLFVWEDTTTGVPLFTPGSWLPYALLLSMFNFVFRNIALSGFAFFVTLFSLSSVSMFLLSDKLLSEKTGARSLGFSLFLGIFYSFNIFTAIEFHTPTGHLLYLFGVTPILIVLFIEIEVSRNFGRKATWLLVYVLLYWPLARMINVFVIYLILVPLIGFIVRYGIRIPFKKFMRYCAVVSIATCLVASPGLLTLPFGKTLPTTETYTKSAAELELGNKVVDSIRFIRTFAWECSSDESVAGVLSYSFLPNYQRNPFLIFITFYPIFMIFFLFLYSYPKFQKRDKSKVLGLLLISILSVMFATPSLTPLGELLYQNRIYLPLRSAWKYFTIIYILCLSTSLILLLKPLISKLQERKCAILFMALLLIHSTYILPAICIYGKAVNQAWIVKIPHEYYDLADFLNNDTENYRILPLPITKHFAGYVPYKWGYVGPDILYTLTDKPMIDKHHNVIAPQEYLDLMSQIENATPDELFELCRILNVKYILLRADVEMNHPYQKLNHPPDYYKELLCQSQFVKTSYAFGNLTLYELNNYTPRIFLQPINTLLNSKNPLEVFNETSYETEHITYLCFDETPLTIENDGNNEVIQNFTLNITFEILQKNTTDEDSQTINHALIQTDLFKIVVSPKGLLNFFIYLKNGTYFSIVTPFQRMEKISSLEITFQNSSLSIYLDKAKTYATSLYATELVEEISTIKIGSNFGNTEMLVGKIYDLNYAVNNEAKISTQTLFFDYPNQVSQEEIFKLNLNPLTTEWKKLSPTNYRIKMNYTPQIQNGYFLTFLTTFDQNWKIYLTKNGSTNQIPEERHIKTFNYANTWYINQTGQLEITIEYEPQRWFFCGSIISVATILACLIYLTCNWTKNKAFWKRIETILRAR